MIKDLRTESGLCNSLEEVILVDKQKRITSPYFNVWIRSLMDGIEPSLDDVDSNINLKSVLLNDDTSFMDGKVTTSGCIRAEALTPYRFKHEGWIPEFETESSTYQDMSMETGKGKEMSSATSEGTTKGVPDHPPHPIEAGFKMLSNIFKKFSFKQIVSKKMVHTNSTKVDYQELNRIYIKKGDILVGSFVNGSSDGKFMILGIPGAVPYYDEDEDNGKNDMMPTQE